MEEYAFLFGGHKLDSLHALASSVMISHKFNVCFVDIS